MKSTYTQDLRKERSSEQSRKKLHGGKGPELSICGWVGFA